MSRDPVTGWKLPPDERARLLEAIPPRFAQVVADHVTLRSLTGADTLVPSETGGRIVGQIDDGEGVQAVIVAIGKSTTRADGATYHITWSLAAGRDAKESNDVIERLGWRPLAAPIAVELQPARWPRGGE
jgi:hypothetical protein